MKLAEELIEIGISKKESMLKWTFSNGILIPKPIVHNKEYPKNYVNPIIEKNCTIINLKYKYSCTIKPIHTIDLLKNVKSKLYHLINTNIFKLNKTKINPTTITSPISISTVLTPAYLANSKEIPNPSDQQTNKNPSTQKNPTRHSRIQSNQAKAIPQQLQPQPTKLSKTPARNSNPKIISFKERLAKVQKFRNSRSVAIINPDRIKIPPSPQYKYKSCYNLDLD